MGCVNFGNFLDPSKCVVIERDGPPAFHRSLDSVCRISGVAGVAVVERQADQAVGERGDAHRISGVHPADPAVRPQPGLSVCREGELDSVAGRVVPHRDRRHRPANGRHDDADRIHCRPVVLERDRYAAEGILLLFPDPTSGNVGRVRLARLSAVLPVLGNHPGADVFHHRDLGWTAAGICGDQIRHIYGDGIDFDAARHHYAVLPSRAAVPGIHVQHQRID